MLMTSKRRAALNTAALISPLFLGLSYSMLLSPGIPDSIIIPTTGGGLMNLGFWLFYPDTIARIPELHGFLGKNRNMFLLVSILHLAAILILLIYDVSWVFGVL